jgi:adenylate kinase
VTLRCATPEPVGASGGAEVVEFRELPTELILEGAHSRACGINVNRRKVAMKATKSPVLALILFGPPGSGKGTQAKLLAEHLGLPHVSTGDMLRHYVQAEDPHGRDIRAVMQEGNLVPDEFVNQLVARRIAQPDCASGFILDGYPRTLPQAQIVFRLQETLGIQLEVIHLKLDDRIVLARLTGRRQCSQCGALYNLVLNPPETPGRCDKDGAILVVRDDDRESVIRRRLEAYEKQTRGLLDYFEKQGASLY